MSESKHGNKPTKTNKTMKNETQTQKAEIEISAFWTTNGIRLNATVEQARYSRLYQGYSKKAANELFKKYIQEEESKIFVNQP